MIPIFPSPAICTCKTLFVFFCFYLESIFGLIIGHLLAMNMMYRVCSHLMLEYYESNVEKCSVFLTCSCAYTVETMIKPFYRVLLLVILLLVEILSYGMVVVVLESVSCLSTKCISPQNQYT